MPFESQGRSVGRSVKDVAQGFRSILDGFADFENIQQNMILFEKLRSYFGKFDAI